MNIPSEFDVLGLVCGKLDEFEKPYMLTGSFASNYYAEPRMTRDIDIVLEVSVLDGEKLCLMFGHEFYMEEEAVSDAIKRRSMFNIIHHDTVFKVDFIIRKDEEYRKVELQRRRRVVFNGIPLWIVSPEDLVISKLFWAKESQSQMQLKDIQNILDSVEDLDQEYLEGWIQKLHLEPIFQKLES
ncbi:MAG: hypothetical protein KDK71_06565 [Chlamydiia bacterium]|nr:hypothetical protein [Chlamydiia bacterium]